MPQGRVRSRGAGGALLAVHLERDATSSKQQQLYTHIRNLILSGQAPPGLRLPSTRIMAKELGVSRNTVVAVFEQLEAEGYLVSHIGSGTLVTDSLPEDLLRSFNAGAKRESQGSAQLEVSELARDVMAISGVGVRWARAFSPGMPAIDEFPFDTWAKLLAQEWRNPGLGALTSDAGGYWPLREQIAEYVATSRSVTCEADQIIIVSGHREGTELAARVLLNHGSTVIVEDPGYPGTRSAIVASGMRLAPMPITAEGFDLTQCDAAHTTAKMVCVAPSHQYPMGYTMSLRHRLELISWCCAQRAWILEDDYDSEFRYGERPLPSLYSLDTGDRVIYVGTFSKTLLPSIRLGYLIVPKSLVPVFMAMKLASSGPTSIVTQRAIARFMETGLFHRHVRMMRKLYAARRQVLELELQRTWPELTIPPQEAAGLFILTLFDAAMGDITDVSLVETAQKLGIHLVALSSHYMAGHPRNGLIFGYGAMAESECRETLLRLRATIKG